jgi:hypothetical protein
VVGFIESTKQIVTIPAGAIVTIRSNMLPPTGLCMVVWDGKLIEAYRIDIEQNGAVVSENESVGSKRPI